MCVGKKTNIKSSIDNYSHRCIRLQQMAKIKDQLNTILCAYGYELLLIAPLHYCLPHTEPNTE